jgi:hypothetical protein
MRIFTDAVSALTDEPRIAIFRPKASQTTFWGIPMRYNRAGAVAYRFSKTVLSKIDDDLVKMVREGGLKAGFAQIQANTVGLSSDFHFKTECGECRKFGFRRASVP